jgi:hypothetical protein
LNDRLLLYLATDADGVEPWIYAMDIERRVPHRISMAVEEYTSLAASGDGRRVVATVSRRTAHLWRILIGAGVMEEPDATAIPLPTGSGLSPRIASGSVIYRAPRGGTDGLWKLTNEGIGMELWNGRNGRAMAGAAIAPDGQHLAFLVQRAAATHLYIMSTDGTGTRRVAVDLDVRGAPAWLDGAIIFDRTREESDIVLFDLPVPQMAADNERRR